MIHAGANLDEKLIGLSVVFLLCLPIYKCIMFSPYIICTLQKIVDSSSGVDTSRGKFRQEPDRAQLEMNNSL